MRDGGSICGTALCQLEGESGVHIWQKDLTACCSSSEDSWEILSHDEALRADKYRFAEDREMFATRRAFLRCVLASYTDCDPADLSFEYGRFGKPRLAGRQKHSHLSFSSAHSGDLVLIGVAYRRAIGVDVEELRIVDGYRGIAERLFSVEEQEYLFATSERCAHTRFLEIWTLKEAYVKAYGRGLPLLGPELDVSPYLGASNVTSEKIYTDGLCNWTLQGIVPATGYVGAICTAG